MKSKNDTIKNDDYEKYLQTMRQLSLSRDKWILSEKLSTGDILIFISASLASLGIIPLSQWWILSSDMKRLKRITFKEKMKYMLLRHSLRMPNYLQQVY